MTHRIPVTITEVLAKSVEKNLVALSEFLQLWSESDDRDSLARSERFDSIVRIEQVR